MNTAFGIGAQNAVRQANGSVPILPVLTGTTSSRK
jgi:hypothetical protein